MPSLGPKEAETSAENRNTACGLHTSEPLVAQCVNPPQLCVLTLPGDGMGGAKVKTKAARFLPRTPPERIQNKPPTIW